MKKIVLSTFAAVAGVFLASCAAAPYSAGPGSAVPYQLYSAGVTYPALNTNQTVHNYDSEDFSRLGTVTATGTSTNIFMIINDGDNGYELLVKEAQALGADEVINVKADVTTSNILGVVTVETKMMGTAIKYN